MIIDTQPQVLSHIKVDIIFQDLEQKIQTSKTSQIILRTAETVFEKVKKKWNPRAVFRWIDIHSIQDEKATVIIPESQDVLLLDFGHSIQFLTFARQALISVYTLGQELERESLRFSSKGNLLEAYLIDLIGLIVLDRTGQTIKKIAEKQAENLGWGVSPFLSPGSVHGWDLEDQIKLCSLLPLEKINTEIRDDAVLSPFKTISCLIGVGPGYDAVHVGTTCQVCSKNKDCPMKKEESKC